MLDGIKQSVELRDITITDNTINTYNNLVNELMGYLNEDLSEYKMNSNDVNHSRYFLYKIIPIINYLKNMYIESSEYQIEKVGALYRSLDDKELRKRCEDILLGEDAFDRAINQATQVLEDRIKKKAGLEKTPLIGLPLVSNAIHKDFSLTKLKFSDEPDVQEGYANLFKGIVSIYRNPTHHTLGYHCSREYALKTCAFIDDLLKEVDNSIKVK